MQDQILAEFVSGDLRASALVEPYFWSVDLNEDGRRTWLVLGQARLPWQTRGRSCPS